MTTMAKTYIMHMNINNLIYKTRPEEDFWKNVVLIQPHLHRTGCRITHSSRFLAKTKPILTEKALVVIMNASSVHLMDHLFPHFTKNTRAHEYLPPSKAIPLIGLRMLK